MIYLSNDDIARRLTPENCIEALEDAFEHLANGRAISRPRTDVWVPCDRPDGYYRWGSMEGAIEPLGIFATRMKSDIVTWTPQGTDELHCGAPGTFSGFLMLFSTRTGEPLAIMNDGILHHLRVAAGAALGVKYLARQDAKVIGILGSGGMARSYLSAICAIRGISRVKVYSPTRSNREAFAEEMSEKLGVVVEALDDPESVVRNSDIVATCTDSGTPVVTEKAWIGEGMHLTNLSAKEWGLDVVRSCDVVVQIGEETFRGENRNTSSGRERNWAAWVLGRPDEIARIPKRSVNNIDFMSYPSFVDVFQDRGRCRTSPSQITFFHNLGLLGFQFAATAAKALDLAKQSGVGIQISTEPFLQNIRD